MQGKMKIDRQYYETKEWDGEKVYKFRKIAENIGAYISKWGYNETWFEIDTDERIGGIFESDVKMSRKQYFNAQCCYGWDGKKATRKEKYKGLCTRADYQTAASLLMEEYKNRK